MLFQHGRIQVPRSTIAFRDAGDLDLRLARARESPIAYIYRAPERRTPPVLDNPRVNELSECSRHFTLIPCFTALRLIVAWISMALSLITDVLPIKSECLHYKFVGMHL